MIQGNRGKIVVVGTVRLRNVDHNCEVARHDLCAFQRMAVVE